MSPTSTIKAQVQNRSRNAQNRVRTGPAAASRAAAVVGEYGGGGAEVAECGGGWRWMMEAGSDQFVRSCLGPNSQTATKQRDRTVINYMITGCYYKVATQEEKTSLQGKPLQLHTQNDMPLSYGTTSIYSDLLTKGILNG